MIILLYIIGIIGLIISIVIGIGTGSFWGFIISLSGGFASSIILFALASILDNQETILSSLASQEEKQRKYINKEKTTCPRCDREYDVDFSSCPHCGHRD